MGHAVFHLGIDFRLGMAARVGAHRIDYRTYSATCGRNPRLWFESSRLINLVRHTGGGKPSNRLAKPTCGLVGLLLKRGSARMGLKGYLLRHDAVYGHSVNRLTSDHILPTNCFMVA